MEWKIFYSDHSKEQDTSVSSEKFTPYSIPKGHREDVQVIIQPDSEHNWVTLSGYDYYMWDDRGGGEKWFGGDREGLSSYLRKPGYKCVLIGEMIDKKLFEEIFRVAIKERGKKNGYNNIERKP